MRVRDYELEEPPLGSGGMGVVHRAVHVNLKAQRAIKLLFADAQGQQDRRKRFLLEAKTQFDLRHPNIIEVFDCFEEDSRLYIVMEYVRGESLKRLIEHRYNTKGVNLLSPEFRGFKLDRANCIEILCQCLDALAYAHGKGVVHRDIKPANIMIALSETGQPIVKLADFGIAKIIAQEQEQERLTKSGETLGTVHYMPPEQIELSVPIYIDARADLYALGISMFEMLTGQLPFGDKDTGIMKVIYNKIHNDPPNLIKHKGSIPHAYYRIIERAIKKDPQERFQDASEFKAALLETQDTTATKPINKQATTTTATHRIVSVKTGDKRKKGIIISAIVVAAVVLVLILVLTNSYAPTPKEKVNNIAEEPSAKESATGELPNEGALAERLASVQASYKQLHLRKTAAMLYDDPLLAEQRQESWQLLKDKEVTLFGLVKSIDSNGDQLDIAIQNTRPNMDHFNMQVKGLISAQQKQPLPGYIIIFEGNITNYIAGNASTPPVLIIDNAKILDVLERKLFRNLRERIQRDNTLPPAMP
ncbi:MAG: serine/threonine protein kinase [Nitrospirae bacterium]|nr:serine/threonine protein kinase [Nitrospirota bacterium]